PALEQGDADDADDARVSVYMKKLQGSSSFSLPGGKWERMFLVAVPNFGMVVLALFRRSQLDDRHYRHSLYCVMKIRDASSR
ncbi:hypothetical protein, partial [Pseudomonas syringae]|uniref:hypothetical protein n=1 Tax=Pseudomonas syringae TaxID=317 RepID=UPI0034D6200D